MSKISGQLKKLLEYIWLITAIISLGIAIYDSFIHSFKNAIPFYGFFFLALFFFASRRRERLKNS